MRVLFVCSGNTASGINPIIERQGTSLIKKGVDVVYFPIEGKGFKGYYSSISKLRTYLRSNQFDLLHAHYALCGYVAYFGGKKYKRVLSFMGSDLLENSVLTRLNKWIAKSFFDKIILKSDEMMNAFGSSDKKILIPNGVDLEVFKRQDKVSAQKALKFDSAKRHIIFVANPARQAKNFQLAKKATDLLDKSKYELHIVFNLETEQLVQYYNAADVVLMTSLHEGSPNVIKEAMACGCPIVTTNVGDVAYLLKDVKGCFVTDLNEENIKNSIIEAAEHGITNGKEKLMQLKLSSEDVADKLLELYKSIK